MLMNPLIQATKALGGSGTIDEINNKVVELAGLSDEQLEVAHDLDKSGHSEVEYRLAWARTYLKRHGILENSTRGVWALTAKGSKLEKVGSREVVRVVRAEMKKAHGAAGDELEEQAAEPTWREQLLATLQRMKPDAFERLVQRVLRESGFVHVEVTGRSGDGVLMVSLFASNLRGLGPITWWSFPPSIQAAEHPNKSACNNSGLGNRKGLRPVRQVGSVDQRPDLTSVGFA